MNNRGHTFGGPWTEQKLKCVSKYLSAYTTIMNNYTFHFAYIDAFAGMGHRELKRESDTAIRRFLAGSARRALEVEPPFKEYVFIEDNKASCAELRKLTREFPNRNIKCINMDANKYLADFCQKREWRTNRALVFLDPYGMQVEWKTIELIARTQAIDLWLLFPIGMSVNRKLKNDAEIGPSERQKLDMLFGGPDWFDEFYQIKPQLQLFSEEEVMEKKDNIFAAIEEYFMARLQSIFTKVADNPLPLRNSKNSLMYQLYFAAGNPKGASTAVKIAQHILSKQLQENVSSAK